MCPPSDHQTASVKNYLLDILLSMLQEVESFSQEILDSILANIIDPIKVSPYIIGVSKVITILPLCFLQTTNRPLYNFTVELIRKASPSIEPLIHRVRLCVCVSLGNTFSSIVTNTMNDPLPIHTIIVCYSLLVFG